VLLPPFFGVEIGKAVAFLASATATGATSLMFLMKGLVWLNSLESKSQGISMSGRDRIHLVVGVARDPHHIAHLVFISFPVDDGIPFSGRMK
jgi:hypothetical protein